MEPLLYIILRPILKVLFIIIYRPKIIGKENIPNHGRVVLAGNHTNNLDCILLISSTKRVIHFLAKDSLYKGWKKPLFKSMGIIPVNRSIKDKSVLIKARECLNKDMVVGVFPEGTINRTKDTIMPFKLGASKMSTDTSAPIIPFTIKGKYKVFGGVKIEFYEPLKPTENVIELNERLEDIVKTNLERK